MDCKLVIPHQGERYVGIDVNRQADPAWLGCSPHEDAMKESTTTSEGASTYLPTSSSPA